MYLRRENPCMGVLDNPCKGDAETLAWVAVGTHCRFPSVAVRGYKVEAMRPRA